MGEKGISYCGYFLMGLVEVSVFVLEIVWHSDNCPSSFPLGLLIHSFFFGGGCFCFTTVSPSL